MSAQLTASVYTSHVPAIGAAIDLGKTDEPYWQPLFAGYEDSKAWLWENTPDAIILVFNDHATAFSLEMIPTFAIGPAARFDVPDEGWGPRPVPGVIGHPELGIAMDMSIQLGTESEAICTLSLSFNNDGPFGTSSGTSATPARMSPAMTISKRDVANRSTCRVWTCR